VISPKVQKLTKSEDLARVQIQKCVEEGIEDIQLSHMSLTELSNETIKPLASFVKQSAAWNPHSFCELTPQLRLYLAQNSLSSIPAEIFNLEHLETLSLRNNKLTQLPTAIRQLKRLRELNLGNNRLPYLPFELLDLLNDSTSLEILSLYPNQFLEPTETSKVQASARLPTQLRQSEARHAKSNWLPRYHYRSDVRFLDKTGVLVKGPARFEMRGRGRVHLADPDDVPTPPGAEFSEFSSFAPSLLELSLRTYSKIPNAPSMAEYLGRAPPERLAKVLDRAKAVREMEPNGRRCTVCGREFVVPRTEWIEWWSVERRGGGFESQGSKTETLLSPTASPSRDTFGNPPNEVPKVPFMRRGCSWRCSPTKSYS
jgi:hypothetical protein